MRRNVFAQSLRNLHRMHLVIYAPNFGYNKTSGLESLFEIILANFDSRYRNLAFSSVQTLCFRDTTSASRLSLKTRTRIYITGYPLNEYSMSMNLVGRLLRLRYSGYSHRWSLYGKPYITQRTKNKTDEICMSNKIPSIL